MNQHQQQRAHHHPKLNANVTIPFHPYSIWSPVAAADQTKVKAVPLTGGYQVVPVFTIR